MGTLRWLLLSKCFRRVLTTVLAAQVLGCASPVFFLKVKDPTKVQIEPGPAPETSGAFREADREYRMQCHDGDDDLTRRSVAWAAFVLTKAKPDREIMLECPVVRASDHGVQPSLSTQAWNVSGLEREVRWGLAVGAGAAVIAAIPASICSIGGLAAPPDQREGAWRCAGISAAFVVAGIALALFNPTARATVAPSPRPIHGFCKCSYLWESAPPSSCSDPRCGPVESD